MQPWQTMVAMATRMTGQQTTISLTNSVRSVMRAEKGTVTVGEIRRESGIATANETGAAVGTNTAIVLDTTAGIVPDTAAEIEIETDTETAFVVQTLMQPCARSEIAKHEITATTTTTEAAVVTSTGTAGRAVGVARRNVRGVALRNGEGNQGRVPVIVIVDEVAAGRGGSLVSSLA